MHEVVVLLRANFFRLCREQVRVLRARAVRGNLCLQLRLLLIEPAWLALDHDFLGANHGLHVVFDFANGLSHFLPRCDAVEHFGSHVDETTKHAGSAAVMITAHAVLKRPVRARRVHHPLLILLVLARVARLVQRVRHALLGRWRYLALVVGLSHMASACCHAAVGARARRRRVERHARDRRHALRILPLECRTPANRKVLLAHVASRRMVRLCRINCHCSLKLRK